MPLGRWALVLLACIGCSSEASQRVLLVEQDGGAEGGSGGSGSSSSVDAAPVGFGEWCPVDRCEADLECTEFRVNENGSKVQMCSVPCDDGGGVCESMGGRCIRQSTLASLVCCPDSLLGDCDEVDSG